MHKPAPLYNVRGELQTQREAVERSGALDAQTHQVRTARRGTEGVLGRLSAILM